MQELKAELRRLQLEYHLAAEYWRRTKHFTLDSDHIAKLKKIEAAADRIKAEIDKKNSKV